MYRLSYDAIPVAFYPYTSSVQDRILQLQFSENLEIKQLRNRMIEWFNKNGILAKMDNKIVFEVELYGKRLFYGFYDFTFSIGFSVSHDAWIKPITKG